MIETEKLELEIAQLGAKFTPLGLNLPEEMPFADWTRIGQKLLRTDQLMQWWIGDWAAFGVGNPDKEGWRKKGKLREFCEANGFRVDTAQDHAWVSRSVHLSLRKESVPWSIYKEIAPLKPKDQMKWLKAAESENLAVRDLRKQIRTFYGTENGLEKDGVAMKLGTKLKCDLMRFFTDKDESFWTETTIAIWKKEIRDLMNYLDEKDCALRANAGCTVKSKVC